MLPEILRPRNVHYRRFVPGLDLPAWFYHDIKGLDNKLHFVYHPYKVIWDDIQNEYEGELDDPRFTIHVDHGELNWGWVLKDKSGAPLPENTWHIWRLCDPYGWAHIVEVSSKEAGYLKVLLSRLRLQASYRDKYGDIAWNKLSREKTDELKEQQRKDNEEMFGVVHEENSWLMKKAMDNFASGKVAPTNPTKESIISYPNQGSKSKIVRPLTDTEGGLVIPD